MQRHLVTAHNPATASENRIHADDVARRYGFRGGLVPGVTVYGYACTPIVGSLGPDWVEHGTCRLRFVAPCYEGETLSVTVDRTRGSADVEDVKAEVGDRTCAVGEAGIGTSVGAVNPAAAIPWRDTPAERQAASEELFTPGSVLGAVRLATEKPAVDRYLDMIGEPSQVYRERGWVHPGMLLTGANSVLVANALMPAWIHVESSVQHMRAVETGESIEVRGRVSDAFERKGHRFVVADIAWISGAGPDAGEVVASGRHSAIWQLAG